MSLNSILFLIKRIYDNGYSDKFKSIPKICGNLLYEKGWLDLNIFIHIGFLSEETGEVGRAIRVFKIKKRGAYTPLEDLLDILLDNFLETVKITLFNSINTF